MVLNDPALPASCLRYCPRVAPHYSCLPARQACRCGLCGETVAKAKPDKVFRTASIWQRSAAATRARMALWGSGLTSG
jgi:hypothetical protein